MPIIPLIFSDDTTVFGMTNEMGFRYLLKSTDAGLNWMINRSDGVIPVRMIRIPTTRSLCYAAVGPLDIIFKSTNNGESWVMLHENKFVLKNGLKSLAFIDSVYGVAVGIGSQIMRTIDGGLSWDYLHRGHRANWNDLLFLDDRIGFVVGINMENAFGGLVYRTSDGGRSWNMINVHTIQSIDFSDRMTGWITGQADVRAGGSYQMVFKTSNGGIDWTAVYSWPGLDSSIFLGRDVSFPSNKDGWIAAGSGLLHTTDGGMSWMNFKHTFNVASNYSVERVEFMDQKIGFALLIGSEIKIRDRTAMYRTTDAGITWEQIFSKLLFIDSKGITTGFRLVDFIIRKPNSIWLQCESLSRALTNLPDTLFRSTDSGVSWDAFPSSVGFRAPRQPMFFFDELNGWTYSGTIAYTTKDGGKTWTQHSSYTNFFGIFAKTFFINQKVGWGAGQNGEILHTTTGGLNSISAFISAPSFSLSQNYPNPTSSMTTIPFEITSALSSRELNRSIKLVIYDLLGREVATLLRDQLDVGKNQISFDASRLQAGVYYYRLMVGEQAVTRKMVVVR